MTNVYDLEAEVKGAQMPDASGLVTPSGFKIIAHPEYRETARLIAPNGSVYDFDRIYNSLDPDNLSSGSTMDVYLPDQVEMEGVKSSSANYGLRLFLEELMIKFAHLEDSFISGCKPTSVRILKA